MIFLNRLIKVGHQTALRGEAGKIDKRTPPVEWKSENGISDMPIMKLTNTNNNPVIHKRTLIQTIIDAVSKTLTVNSEWKTTLVKELERSHTEIGGEFKQSRK